ncbi:conserved exported protein of unknown function [Rhodovastum atsumiense]|uniref:DUF4148 domain-containing protein n=1 Tax=Rhodovastum atsumiense TaxID=504468 RepID=A0A5M6INX9_9PROT|nr:hypothetical protein [Rhodovastum atsumiense]KAA5609962.1 hypothetical protein F1189_21430 [Rhodovastum atsumiense]CAH2598601.1 conserved exported protein of unknown function [Rhodovastum atsumiense]
MPPRTMPRLAFFATLLLPAVATGQPARNGNVWDGTAHQPGATGVEDSQRRAGVAPSDAQARQEEQDLDRIGRQLNDRAAQDAAAVPESKSNAYGVRPGGEIPITQPPKTTPPQR